MNIPVSSYDKGTQAGDLYCPRCDDTYPAKKAEDVFEGVRGYCPRCKSQGHASELFTLPYARSEGYVNLVKDPKKKLNKGGT